MFVDGAFLDFLEGDYFTSLSFFILLQERVILVKIVFDPFLFVVQKFGVMKIIGQLGEFSLDLHLPLGNSADLK